jgi:hypothetical protein
MALGLLVNNGADGILPFIHMCLHADPCQFL